VTVGLSRTSLYEINADATFEVPAEVLLNIQDFWDTTPWRKVS
jgi:hypothetical protein